MTYNNPSNIVLVFSFLSLLEELLRRFETEKGGQLIVATLCLLEASAAGLLESELRQILADEEKLMPPSPFDEKGKTLEHINRGPQGRLGMHNCAASINKVFIIIINL